MEQWHELPVINFLFNPQWSILIVALIWVKCTSLTFFSLMAVVTLFLALRELVKTASPPTPIITLTVAPPPPVFHSLCDEAMREKRTSPHLSCWDSYLLSNEFDGGITAAADGQLTKALGCCCVCVHIVGWEKGRQQARRWHNKGEFGLTKERRVYLKHLFLITWKFHYIIPLIMFSFFQVIILSMWILPNHSMIWVIGPNQFMRHTNLFHLFTRLSDAHFNSISLFYLI